MVNLKSTRLSNVFVFNPFRLIPIANSYTIDKIQSDI